MACPRPKGTAAALLLGLALTGCAAEGDFGRRQPSVVADEILPLAGAVAARRREEPVSSLPLTDDEKEFRDRAWLFLMPAHPRAEFDRLLAELHRVRILPSHADNQRPDVYFAALMAEGAASSRTPYRRLMDDMAADNALLDPLGAIADRVEGADAVRERFLPAVSDLRPEERDDALARIAENRGLAHWLDDAIERRVLAYRYALQRLVIAVPDRDGVAAEHALEALAARVRLPGGRLDRSTRR